MTHKSLADLVRERIDSVEWDKAERLIRRSATRGEHPATPAEIGDSVLSLASAYRSWNRRDDARAFLNWAANWLDGRDRVWYGKVLRTLGEVETDLGMYELAVRTLNTAFENHKTELGEAHLETIRDLMSLGNLARAVDKPEQASSLFAEAVERVERGEGPNSEELIGPLKAQAETLLDSDLPHETRCVPAEASLRRALQLQEKTDPSSLESGWTRMDLADLLHEHEQCDDSLAVASRAWEIGRAHVEEDSRLFEDATGWLVWWYEAHHQYSPMVDALKTALTIWIDLVGPDNPKVAQTMSALGNAYLLNEREDEADDLCARALDILATRFGELPMPNDLLPVTLEDVAAIRLSIASVLGVRAAIALRRERGMAAEFFALRALYMLDLPQGQYSADTQVTLSTARSDILRQLAHCAGTEPSAEEYFRRAILEAEQPGAGVLADALDDYADWLQACGREAEAEQTRKQAEAVWDSSEE